MSTSRSPASRRVLYIQYAPSAMFPPLLHSASILVARGWEPRVLCVEAYGTDSALPAAMEHVRMRCLASRPPGWRQKLRYARFCGWVLAIVSGWRPRWVYVSDPLAALPGLLATFLPRVRVLYHEHDSPASTNPMRLARFTRRWLARRAALCVLPNHDRAERFRSETGCQRVAVVWNCPSKAEALPAPRPAREGLGLTVYYHGVLNEVLVPETVLRAISRLPETVRLRAVGYETVGGRGHVQRLRALAEQLGITDRVDFLPAMPRSELPGLARDCDVGLALTSTTPAHVNYRYLAGASNKAFDYLAHGLAVLATDLPDWREMYGDAECATFCDPADPASIAEALEWFLAHPIEMRQMGERGRQRVLADWNYEHQFTKVLERMEQ